MTNNPIVSIPSPLLIAIPLLRPGETTPYQAYTTFQDISAERKANQKYQRLFHEMVDAFALHEIILDAQGETRGLSVPDGKPGF